MVKGLFRKIQKLGVRYETSYLNKRDLVGFNTTFFWTNVLIFLNIFIAASQGLRHIAIINLCGNLTFIIILYLNHLGLFRFNRHIGIISANIYVFAMCIASGPDLQFEFAYTIILTVIGIVFTQRRYLLIHLPLTILFFIGVMVMYRYVEPWEQIPPGERYYFAFNNGIIFMTLVSVVAFGFRNQSSYYLAEIEVKKNLIEEKQKEIFDSITYAQRIQASLLGSTSQLDDCLGQGRYFLRFFPKDIVSGDFYWTASVTARYSTTESGFAVRKTDELFYLAVCDSTGHGVPGAFMSVINMGCLKEAIREKNIYEPNQVFDFVRKRLIETISKGEHKDGFDGVLLCINRTTRQMAYVAANNYPVLYRKGDTRRLPTDKMPVGSGGKTGQFMLHLLDIEEGDLLYIFTDGYADQFGGPKGKKLMHHGVETLIRECAGMSMDEQGRRFEESFHLWRGQLDQIDDVCMIGIRF